MSLPSTSAVFIPFLRSQTHLNDGARREGGEPNVSSTPVQEVYRIGAVCVRLLHDGRSIAIIALKTELTRLRKQYKV